MKFSILSVIDIVLWVVVGVLNQSVIIWLCVTAVIIKTIRINYLESQK